MSCHGVTVGAGSVAILGAPLHYQPDAFYDITVRISDPNQLGAGFQLSAEDASGIPVGMLSVIDGVNTQLNPDDSDWVNHTADGVVNSVADWAANGNSADYTVRWQAPSSDVGAVTFWAAGNAIDNNLNLTGDFVYLANKSATIVQVPAVSEWGVVILTLCLLTAGTLALSQLPAPVETNNANGFYNHGNCADVRASLLRRTVPYDEFRSNAARFKGGLYTLAASRFWPRHRTGGNHVRMAPADKV